MKKINKIFIVRIVSIGNVTKYLAFDSKKKPFNTILQSLAKEFESENDAIKAIIKCSNKVLNNGFEIITILKVI